MRFNENNLIAEAYAKVNEAKKKPSAGLTKKQKSNVAKKARAGKDIGKKGPGFAKMAKAAGGGEKGKKIAAAAMWKSIKRESADIASIYRQKLLGESVNEDSSLGGRVKVTFGEYEIGTYDNLKEMQNGIAEYIANDLYDSVEGEEGEDYDYDSIRDEAIEQSLLVIDAFEETINNDRQGGNIFGTDYTVLDAEVNGSVDSYDGIWTFRFVGVEKESTSESDLMIPKVEKILQKMTEDYGSEDLAVEELSKWDEDEMNEYYNNHFTESE